MTTTADLSLPLEEDEEDPPPGNQLMVYCQVVSKWPS